MTTRVTLISIIVAACAACGESGSGSSTGGASEGSASTGGGTTTDGPTTGGATTGGTTTGSTGSVTASTGEGSSTGEDSSGGSTGGTSGEAPPVDEYCACMLENCHDQYHATWGEDHVMSEMMCLAYAGSLPTVGMPAMTGDSLECRYYACTQSDCVSALDGGVCM